MSVVLAIDTSRDDCALACAVLPSAGVDGLGDVAEDTRSIPRRHNEHVLAMLDELLKRAAIAPREIDVIAFAAGPGSFTGIRIAAAITQAMALAAGARIVRVPSSRHLARSSIAQGGTPASFWTALYSRQDRFYGARYEGDVCVRPDTLMSLDALSTAADGPVYCDQAVTPHTDDAGFRVVRPRIRDLLALGCDEFLAGRGLPASAAIPEYVDGDMPWRANP